MTRPELIYLEQPIDLGGIKVGHTEEGLKYLIEHYTEMLTAGRTKRTEEVRQHMEARIITWRQHLELYQRYRHTLNSEGI